MVMIHIVVFFKICTVRIYISEVYKSKYPLTPFTIYSMHFMNIFGEGNMTDCYAYIINRHFNFTLCNK